VTFVADVEGLQDALRMVVKELLGGAAIEAWPRGRRTRELIGATVRIADPRNRLVLRPSSRPWSLPFAMGEYLWYMRGENSVKTMAYYAPKMEEFSDDGVTLNSAYGFRIFGRHSAVGFDQWGAVKSLLSRDPDSRQAMVQIRTPRDAVVTTKDHPCTIALQFLQRRGRLHLVTTMRSNDVVLGTPYDIFSFTMMQEQMALELGLELGSYVHQVGSWHLYTDQTAIVEELVEMPQHPESMPHAGHGLDQMVADEEAIRAGKRVALGDGYWRDWRLALSVYAGHPEEIDDLREPYRLAWDMGRQRRADPLHGAKT
jgi:thymidylate synthase